MTELPGEIQRLLRPERLASLRVEEGGVLTDLPEREAPRSRRFEGLYGRIYNKVIQTPALRRRAFSLWGSTDPLQDLETFVAGAAGAASAAARDAVLIDVPSGGGTLLAFLAALRYAGTVVEVDVATAMMRRAVQAERELPSREFRTVFLRSDALDLPLSGGVADAVVSINGLHVVSDHAGFVQELARITRPGGSLWLVTPIDAPSLRSRLILRAARTLEITPCTPPTLAQLRALLERSGFADLHWWGGESITGFSCRRQR